MMLPSLSLLGTMHRLFIALWLAVAMPATAAAPGAGFGAHLVRLINEYRVAQGLEALALADELVELAHEHSQQMASQRRLSHDGFQSRLRRSRSPLCVENLAWNHPTAETVLDGWRHSPSHNVNLLDPQVMRVGVASSAGYVTFFACR